jgi:hypothetical protein
LAIFWSLSGNFGYKRAQNGSKKEKLLLQKCLQNKCHDHQRVGIIRFFSSLLPVIDGKMMRVGVSGGGVSWLVLIRMSRASSAAHLHWSSKVSTYSTLIWQYVILAEYYTVISLYSNCQQYVPVEFELRNFMAFCGSNIPWCMNLGYP